MKEEQEIKTMKLYHHLDRIDRRLHDLGYAPNQDAGVDPERLGTMDSLHFFGDEPIQRILQLIRGGDDDPSASASASASAAKKSVLDIGTGFGGTARLLAHRSGCRVDALELQPDMSDAARVLTRKCGLEALVRHQTGDFLHLSVPTNEYDVAVGLLCFLHIGNWAALFRRCFAALKPGGALYVEDFFLRGTALSREDATVLREDIYCASLHARAELLALLAAAGFEDVAFDDATAKWKPYVVNRHVAYRAALAEHVARDGKHVAEGLDHFYYSVAKVFQGGSVGGFVLTARKPLAA
ncbi:hypothetical protein PybrP1_007514 [[Pythium] brassicae (nom. inval.)]|nr:hypothetical protein PybrP1_007514 [[Pythium] brassicae (nom. inval.)]